MSKTPRFVFLASLPLALYWISTIVLDKTLDVTLPQAVGLPNYYVHSALLVLLYVSNGFLFTPIFRRFPALLTTRDKKPGQVFKGIALSCFIVYAVGFTLGLLGGWLSGPMIGERGVLVWLLSVWLPIWIAVPLGILVYDLLSCTDKKSHR